MVLYFFLCNLDLKEGILSYFLVVVACVGLIEVIGRIPEGVSSTSESR